MNQEFTGFKQAKTLCDCFLQGQSQLKIFDLSRHIEPIPTNRFQHLEAGDDAYPYPLQQHAWLAFLFWAKQDARQHFIWFLKMPLNDHGLLDPIARDDFLTRLTASQHTMDQHRERMEQGGDPLANNPYTFQPAAEKMAVFHSLASRLLELPPSQYHAKAVHYLSTHDAYEHWQDLPFQGLADVCLRAEQERPMQQLLDRALPSLPDEPFHALCQCCEHVNLPESLVDTLLALLPDDDRMRQHPRLPSLLRALSRSDAAQTELAELIDRILDTDTAPDTELLATMAARNWTLLQKPARCRRWMEHMAHADQQFRFFTPLLAEMIHLPGLRPAILASLRHPQRSAILSQHLRLLFQAGQTPTHEPTR